MKDYRKEIEAYICREIVVLQELEIDQINEVLHVLENAFQTEKTIYIFGNGGSAATASHFQNDFNKGISEYTKKKFHFQCLNDNVATIMAIANDIGYDEVFRFQLSGKLKKGDVVVAISGSGNSENVLNAAEYAKEHQATVIGMTGYEGGRLKEICHYSLHVPVNSMQMTEDVHMIFDHLMMSIFYRNMCGIEHIREYAGRKQG